MRTDLVLWATFSCMSISAADHLNLEEGLPTQLEDAYPVAYRGREVQGHVTYERTGDDKNRVILEPAVEFGFAPNAQGKITAPFYVGDADKRGSGTLGMEVFYNFNTEGIILPAFAASARADVPTGRDTAGLDTTLKFIATKSITETGTDRLHVNASWVHNAGQLPDEREHLYRLVFGYSRRLGADTVIVADYVREQERKADETLDILEIGLRRQITPLTVISGGIGAGLSKDSPDVRVTVGLQKSF